MARDSLTFKVKVQSCELFLKFTLKQFRVLGALPFTNMVRIYLYEKLVCNSPNVSGFRRHYEFLTITVTVIE